MQAWQAARDTFRGMTSRAGSGSALKLGRGEDQSRGPLLTEQ